MQNSVVKILLTEVKFRVAANLKYFSIIIYDIQNQISASVQSRDKGRNKSVSWTDVNKRNRTN